MHRWIVENDYGPDDEFGIGCTTIGDTTIATYWPGLYFRVTTRRVDRENIAVRLTWALKTGSDSKTPNA